MPARYNTLKINFSTSSIPGSYLGNYVNQWSSHTNYGVAYACVFTGSTSFNPATGFYSGYPAYCSIFVPYSGKSVTIQQETTTSRKYTVVVRRPGMGWLTASTTLNSSSSSAITEWNISYGGGAITGASTYTLLDYGAGYELDNWWIQTTSIDKIVFGAIESDFQSYFPGGYKSYSNMTRKELEEIFSIGKTILIHAGTWTPSSGVYSYASALADGFVERTIIDIHWGNSVPDRYAVLDEPYTYSSNMMAVLVWQYNTPSTNTIGGGSPITARTSNRYMTIREFEAVEEPWYNGENPFYNAESHLYYQYDYGYFPLQADRGIWGSQCGADGADPGYWDYITNAKFNATGGPPNSRTINAPGSGILLPIICSTEKVPVLTSSTTIPYVTTHYVWPSTGKTNISNTFLATLYFSGTTSFYRMQVALGIFTNSTHSTNKLVSYAVWNVNSGRTTSGSTTFRIHDTAAKNYIYFTDTSLTQSSTIYPLAYVRWRTSGGDWTMWESARTNYTSMSLSYLHDNELKIYAFKSSNYWTARTTHTVSMSGTMPYTDSPDYIVKQTLYGRESLDESGISYSVRSKETVFSNSVKTSTFTVDYTIPNTITAFTAAIYSSTWFGSWHNDSASFTKGTKTTASINVGFTVPTYTIQQPISVNFHWGDYGGRSQKYSISAVCRDTLVCVWENTFTPSSQYSQDYTVSLQLPLAYRYINSTVTLSDHHQNSKSGAGWVDSTVTSIVPSSFTFKDSQQNVTINLLITP